MSGRIPQDIVDRVREATDLVELVSRYVTLRQNGRNYTGLCPFHEEHSPSFTVSPSKQLFHCFGCGAGGNAFQLVMRMDTITFPEALRLLAARAGIELPRVPADRPQGSDGLGAVLEQAERHFRRWLRALEGASARAYLADRGIREETVEAFGLGFAPQGWSRLIQEMSGVSPAELERAGLAVPRQSGSGTRSAAGAEAGHAGGWYDRFRNRLIFPIRNVQGRLIGFGGRALDDQMPKYLNSPETPLYHKGRHLYALDTARPAIGNAGTIVVVEGYFDAITLHQAGIRHVVATLGTSLTPDHLHAIRRLVRRAVLLFDPDAAGVRAAVRTVDLFAGSGIAVQVGILPAGEDPDRFVLRRGGEALKALLDRAVPLLEFVIDRLLESVPPGASIDQRIEALEQVLPTMLRIPHAVERAHYTARLAERLGMDERAVASHLSKAWRGQRVGLDGRTVPASPAPGAFGRPKDEELAVQLLAQGKVARETWRERIPVGDLTDPVLRRAAELLLESDAQVDRLISRDEIEPEVRELLTALTVVEGPWEEPEQAFQQVSDRIRLRRIRERLRAAGGDAPAGNEVLHEIRDALKG